MPWLLLLWMACHDGEPASTSLDEDTAAPAEDYDQWGPWSAGTRTVDITGSDGEALRVQIWYPSSESGVATVKYDGLLPGDAHANLPADCSQARPVVAFSHGFGGVRYQSPFLTEHLASHGYVVVAPDHRGNTFVDVDPDVAAIARRRPTDLRDTVDWLFGSDWVGCVDPAGGYAVSGHSFGGYTALAAGGARVDVFGDLSDERIWATVALAPWDAGGILSEGTAEIAIPALVLTGARDEVTPLSMVQGLWEPMTAEPRWLGVFPDAGHYSFSPIACALNTGDGCGPDYLDEERFTGLVNASVLAFLEGARGAPGAFDQLPLDAPELAWETSP